MELKVSDIAALVKGRVVGDGGAVIRGAAGLAEATPSDVSFLKDGRDSATVALLKSTRAGAVIVPAGVAVSGPPAIEVPHPMAAFSQVLGVLAREAQVRPEGVHPTAIVHPTAKIGANVRIGPNCVVEAGAAIDDGACLLAQVYVGARSKVGSDSYLYPQVVLREDVSVGKRCLLHPGVVIGADGYGFFFAEGRHNKIPQVGTVIVEDDVEIGANSTIDRATTGATVIGRGTKIDNLVQVAHNVNVGPLCLLVAQVGVGGSTKLGAGVVLAGQVGVADHLTIGDGARIGAQTGVSKDVPAKAELFGTPAAPVSETLRLHVLFKRLPDLFKEVKKLREMISKHG